ncbi:unnamed protein product [Auanema sp. JU1783]|nr:unnamed protein product [Auanema sp. JU1783]
MYSTNIYRPESRKEDRERRRSRKADLTVNTKEIKHEAGENLASHWSIQLEHMKYCGPACEKGITPIQGFSDSNLHPKVIENAKTLFDELSPLQRYSLPVLMNDNNHLLVHAQTGSGKTAAFILPAIQLVLNSKKVESNETPLVLILENTGSLALQTFLHCSQFAGFTYKTRETTTGCRVSLLTSGADSKAYGQFKTTGDIVVGTMGSIKRELDEKKLNLKKLKLLVLDEADKMMDSQAFGREIIEVYENHIPEETQASLQVAMFSATYETMEQDLVFTNVMNILFNDVTKVNCLIAPKIRGFITQRVISIAVPNTLVLETPDVMISCCAFQRKIRWLESLLNEDLIEQNVSQQGPFKGVTIVFCSTRRLCNYLSTYLSSRGYNVAPYNSDFDLTYSSAVHSRAREGKVQAVVATNKIARGLDIQNIFHVIIFDMDEDFSIYEHRIGRTGRAGHGGKSTILFDENRDFKMALSLHRFFVEHGQPIPKWLDNAAESIRSQTEVLMKHRALCQPVDDDDAEDVIPEFH